MIEHNTQHQLPLDPRAIRNSLCKIAHARYAPWILPYETAPSSTGARRVRRANTNGRGGTGRPTATWDTGIIFLKVEAFELCHKSFTEENMQDAYASSSGAWVERRRRRRFACPSTS